VFGKELAIHKIAKKIDMISYEMLTSISSRVKRVYFEE
jgi:alanine racemase